MNTQPGYSNIPPTHCSLHSTRSLKPPFYKYQTKTSAVYYLSGVYPLIFINKYFISKHMKATWNNQVIAESNNTVIVENNHYFPLDSVKADYLKSHRRPIPPARGKAWHRIIRLTLMVCKTPMRRGITPSQSRPLQTLPGPCSVLEGR